MVRPHLGAVRCHGGPILGTFPLTALTSIDWDARNDEGQAGSSSCRVSTSSAQACRLTAFSTKRPREA